MNKSKKLNAKSSGKMKQELYTFKSYAELDTKIRIPSIQRGLNQEHVTNLVYYIVAQDSIKAHVILGVIDLVEFKGIYYPIDGMHRMKALETVYRNYPRIKNIPIPCVIYRVESEEDIKEIFLLRNQGIPVPEFIIHDQGNYPKRELLKEIYNELGQVALFVKTHTKRPNVRIDAFINELKDSVPFQAIDTIEQFREWFRMINIKVKEYFTDLAHKRKHHVSIEMWNKCNKYDMYLGLDKHFSYLVEQENVQVNAPAQQPMQLMEEMKEKQ